MDEDRINAIDKKVTEDNEELLELIKRRILNTYRLKEDIIKKLAESLEIEQDELEEILINKLDSSSLEGLHSSLESSKLRCIKNKLHADLKLCWLCDVMELIKPEQADKIKHHLALEIINENKKYEDALKEGKQEIKSLLQK